MTPLPVDLAKACRGVLTSEDCHDLANMPIDEGLGYTFTLLLERGIGDPEAFLPEKGILE